MSGGAELPILWAVVLVAALAEAALHFASWAKIEEELEDGGRRARYARYLTAARPAAAFCLLARIAAAAALVALIVLRADAAVPAAIAAGLLLVLAESVARALGRKWSTPVLLAFLPVLYRLSVPLWPLLRPAQGAAEPEQEVVDAAREEIRVAIEDGTVEGALEEEEKEMIEGVLKFGDVDVAEIITPRTDLECLEADTPLPEALSRLQDFHHSRIPLYEGTVDHVVGIVYVRDLLAAISSTDGGEPSPRDVMREPFFIPETKTIGSLLTEFQRRRVQIAVVLDEYGGVTGLVTVEDILEEIVGEIEDEYDQEDHAHRILRRPSGAVEVDGRVRIDEVNELLEIRIDEDEDYDTLGGYVTASFARVPAPGEEILRDGLLMRILQSDRRRVRRVLLQRTEPQQ